MGNSARTIGVRAVYQPARLVRSEEFVRGDPGGTPELLHDRTVRINRLDPEVARAWAVRTNRPPECRLPLGVAGVVDEGRGKALIPCGLNLPIWHVDTGHRPESGSAKGSAQDWPSRQADRPDASRQNGYDDGPTDDRPLGRQRTPLATNDTAQGHLRLEVGRPFSSEVAAERSSKTSTAPPHLSAGRSTGRFACRWHTPGLCPDRSRPPTRGRVPAPARSRGGCCPWERIARPSRGSSGR